MINFAVPGVYELVELNYIFVKMLLEHPEYFYPSVQINAVYGNFQDCIFEGGRIFHKYSCARKEEIEYIVKLFNELMIPVRLIFTNSQLKKEDYFDRFSNMVLKVCHNSLNEITIVDSGLENYIRERYPNYNFISSTTKCLTSLEECHKELQKANFKQVCWDYNLNKNKQWLNELSAEEKEKSEILINAICPPGCPYRKEHYKLNSQFALNYGRSCKIPGCKIKQSPLHPESNLSNNLSVDELYNIYVPMGFSHFKIEGRTLATIDVLCSYAEYMVKPEYQLYVISQIMKDVKKMKDKQNKLF